MITVKNQVLELTLSAITFVLAVGALALIWPGIMAVFLGVLLLLRSGSTEHAIVVPSWTEVSKLSIVFAS